MLFQKIIDNFLKSEDEFYENAIPLMPYKTTTGNWRFKDKVKWASAPISKKTHGVSSKLTEENEGKDFYSILVDAIDIDNTKIYVKFGTIVRGRFVKKIEGGTKILETMRTEIE